MKQLLANLFAGVGTMASDSASSACVFMYFDEPKCPKNLIK